MEIQKYPRMLFPGGDQSQQYRIVADEDEHKEAVKDGYLEAYSVAPKAPAPTPPGGADAAPDVTDAPKRRGRPPAAQ